MSELSAEKVNNSSGESTNQADRAIAVDIPLLLLRATPWAMSFLLISCLTGAMLILQNTDFEKEETVTVRKIETALPPPPPPPPPLELEQPVTDSATPTIDLIGAGAGPNLKYSAKPELGLSNLEKIEKPEFDKNSLNLRRALEVDFPLIEVKKLDNIPRAVSDGKIVFPRSLVQRGIKHVPTKVELIIDKNGRAYVKKIVDPVYPEMIEPIRTWVSGVKFTVPTKNGRPVQAVYLYTLNFRYRI